MLSIQWQLPTRPGSANSDGLLGDRFEELRRLHAHCVGCLFAIVKQHDAPPDRLPMREHLSALARLLIAPPVEVAVVDYCGFKCRLADCVPLLLELLVLLDSWPAGQPPERLTHHAGTCLRALGWCDPIL